MTAFRVLGWRAYGWCGLGAAISYLGWLRGSYDATHHLQLLALPVIPGLPLRHDTVTAVCGMASATLFLLCVYLWPAVWSPRRRWAYALSATGAVYGMSGWYYISQNGVYHPQTLHWPLTHFLPFPQESAFGTACAAVAVLSLVALGAMMLARLRANIQKAL